jgi:hypothetical protein
MPQLECKVWIKKLLGDVLACSRLHGENDEVKTLTLSIAQFGWMRHSVPWLSWPKPRVRSNYRNKNRMTRGRGGVKCQALESRRTSVPFFVVLSLAPAREPKRETLKNYLLCSCPREGFLLLPELISINKAEKWKVETHHYSERRWQISPYAPPFVSSIIRFKLEIGTGCFQWNRKEQRKDPLPKFWFVALSFVLRGQGPVPWVPIYFPHLVKRTSPYY